MQIPKLLKDYVPQKAMRGRSAENPFILSYSLNQTYTFWPNNERLLWTATDPLTSSNIYNPGVSLAWIYRKPLLLTDINWYWGIDK